MNWIDSGFSQIADLSPECLAAGTFPILFEKAHKSAHRLQQGRSVVVIPLGCGNFESYGAIKSSS